MTYKFRLKPSRSQRTKMNEMLELCRWVYNETLATRKNAWEQEQKTISLYDTIKMLPGWKKEKPELCQVYSQVLQEVCNRVDLAFSAFFRRIKAGEKSGYPRFRGYGRYDSFTYPQLGFKLSDNGLVLSKIGAVEIILHRPIRGKIKTLNVRRDRTDKWYACFSCEVETEPMPANEKAVGIDVGLESFATFSNGEKIPNPRFFRKDEKELAKAQRKLSKAKKGTPDRSKRRKVVSRIYQRISNRRKDFAHKLSRSLVNEYGIIVFEKLKIQVMMNGNWHNMNRSIGDAAWKQLIQCTTYKAEYAGRTCTQVDPRNTSKRCSKCGTLVEKSLAVRIHKCHVCGLKIDRDENAAINILALGLQGLGVSPRNHCLQAMG